MGGMSDQHEHFERPGAWDIAKSVAAAFFGVQSEANRRRDFTHGKLIHYVIAGAFGTLVLVVAIWGLVQLVLLAAQPA